MSGATSSRNDFNVTLNRDSDRAAVDSVMQRARIGEWATRLASRDTTLWSDDPAVQAKLQKAHPNRYYASQGKTMLDYYRWTLSYAGKTAKLAALRAIQSLP